jgi:hypothetical protein
LIAYYGAACALGAVAGVAFVWLWLRIVPAGTNRTFWSAMSDLCRRLLAADDMAEFLGLYKRLAGMLGPYVARNLAGTVIACLPVIALLASIGPLLVQAKHGVNPLWPFLSDVEAAFFAVFILVTLAGILWPRKLGS